MINGFRLSLTPGVPVTTSDVTNAGTIYLTPYLSDDIELFDGAKWVKVRSPEVSWSPSSAIANGSNYDLFAYLISGGIVIEPSAAWTDGTTRADALARQDGRLVKSANHTRLLVGTVRGTGADKVEDSSAKRFLSNLYNPVQRSMANPIEGANTWTYTSATIRQANANTANQFEWVACEAGRRVRVHVLGMGASSSPASLARTLVGIDSITVATLGPALGGGAFGGGNAVSTSTVQNVAAFDGYPGLGYHYAAWLESAGSNAVFVGDENTPSVVQAGMIGEIAA